jgi:hypothetical protein
VLFADTESISKKYRLTAKAGEDLSAYRQAVKLLADNWQAVIHLFYCEICYRLVCEIVTFGDSGIKGVNALMHTKGYSLILAGDLLLLPFYCAVDMTKTSFNNSN